MYLVLGLGNPGPRYADTRHNIGFCVADALAKKFRISQDLHRYHAVYGIGEISGEKIMVAKPLTYMNESGKAAKAILSACNIPCSDLIVVHDDIDLPLGKIRVRHQGSHAGQRGILSIIERLDTDLFTRIRVGVGRPAQKEDIVEYVLSPFAPEEESQLREVIDTAVQCTEKTILDFQKRTPTREESDA